MTERPADDPTNGSVSAPVAGTERITSLDMIRGVAILGILPMNTLAIGLETAAYFNVSADGIGQPLDWVIGVLTMVFVDQKMMALFSMLYGVGVVHEALWEGDIVALYALSAPFFQSAVGDDPAELRDLWFAGGTAMGSMAEAWVLLNAVGRALGLMLIGVALHRVGIVQGACDPAVYRRLARWGLGVGVVISAVGPVLHIATDWSGAYAINGTIPTGVGTIPMALGYVAAIIVWNGSGSRHLERFRNAGRMALSNYLAQTIIGLATLGWLLDDVDLTRTMIVVWILGVWALQLWWSTWWLKRFRYGPFEWAWRCATYRARPSLRR